MLHHFIQKLTFQYKKIARFLGGSAPQTPWNPFLEFLPSLLDSMATVSSIFVSVLMQNYSPKYPKIAPPNLPPLPPPPPRRGLCLLDPCWGPAPDPVGLRRLGAAAPRPLRTLPTYRPRPPPPQKNPAWAPPRVNHPEHDFPRTAI